MHSKEVLTWQFIIIKTQTPGRNPPIKYDNTKKMPQSSLDQFLDFRMVGGNMKKSLLHLNRI